MDKQSKRINNETIKFVNKTYEALSILRTQREDIRYFNYDHNDELIDESVDRMYELLDDMYHKSIDKKAGWVVCNGTMKPKKLVFYECNTPSPRILSPRTPPLKKENKIKVEITDDDKKEDNILETIIKNYASDEELVEEMDEGFETL